MNRDRLYLGFVTALIVTVVIYASYGLLNSEKKDTHYVVSVIVSNSGSDRWNAFKEGLNQGADEAGIVSECCVCFCVFRGCGGVWDSRSVSWKMERTGYRGAL